MLYQGYDCGREVPARCVRDHDEDEAARNSPPASLADTLASELVGTLPWISLTLGLALGLAVVAGIAFLILGLL
jgi:hypothetical protein